MSRLHDLIEQAKLSNPNLGQKLEEEFSRLENRRNFGLVFERHEPEATELYGRPVRRGDKVHILPARGSQKKADPRLWRVDQILRGATPTVELVEVLPGDEPWNAERVGREPATMSVAIEDVVVVAEHTDTIYPGLVETGRVDNAEEDAPAHTVINAENYHALQALTYTHRHAVDCIYIDPPYNTGAKDWKYNNDYVGSDDDYRHSKWLSFMEKRLLLAKDLLNPDDSVLIITVDEKEYLRLGMLLEQSFPEARIQMVTTLITPQGNPRNNQFHRTDEYIFIVGFGDSRPSPQPLAPEWRNGKEGYKAKPINWVSLLRTGSARKREDRPNMFYPIFVQKSEEGPFIRCVGEPFFGDDLSEVVPPDGATVVWPIGRDGELRRWQVSAESARALISEGFLRTGKWNGSNTAIQYLAKANRDGIISGAIPTAGRDYDGSYIVADHHIPLIIPGTTWRIPSHDATRGGTQLIRKLLGSRQFPFPKSLYAVEDILRFYTSEKPEAVVLDFFCGSGTTAHAVMRLNRQDGGRRRSISVTNNEVSADEQKTLRQAGLRPGDPEWEALGICDYVTKPRVAAAITGRTPEGEPIKDDYNFTDEFPMAEGFEANARFFTLTYEHPVSVEYGRAFSRIAPMLWMRAGQRGRIINRLPDCGWDVTDHYGVLGDVDQAGEFVDAVNARKNITHVFIVTDNISAYQRIARGLPEDIDAIRLYESYLTNFTINHGQVTL